jgi:hypothetical protein
MPENRWIEHVRKYAKDNNISYGCAVSEAKSSYVKAPRASTAKARASKTPKTDKPKKKRITKKQTAEVDDYFQKFIDL